MLKVPYYRKGDFSVCFIVEEQINIVIAILNPRIQ